MGLATAIWSGRMVNPKVSPFIFMAWNQDHSYLWIPCFGFVRLMSMVFVVEKKMSEIYLFYLNGPPTALLVVQSPEHGVTQE